MRACLTVLNKAVISHHSVLRINRYGCVKAGDRNKQYAIEKKEENEE